MELRVHAPEAFWTKLSLAGATTLQLGIEAISDPLLKSMRKATTAIQNLAATKYMAEMGTQDASNLIIHHPRSSAADVAETRRVMRLLEHLPVFNLSRFVVSYASPLYNELPEARKAALRRGFDWLPRELEAHGWPRHLSYTWPNTWSDPEAVQAWLGFQAWYTDHLNELAARPLKPSLTVLREPDGLHLHDTRFGHDRRRVLRGLDAEVYDACHRPRKLRQLTEELDFAAGEIQPCLDALEESLALLRIGDTYLSIALRPTAELIANHLGALAAAPRRASGATADIHGMR